MNRSEPEASCGRHSDFESSASHRAAAAVPRLVRLLKETLGEGCPLKQLSMTQVKAMSHLLQTPGETLTGLAAELGIALGTASETIDRLVELDIVERQTNPADRRQVLLSLTPPAATMAREIGRQRIEQFDEVFADLTDAEAAGFLKGLDLWVETLQHRVDTSATVVAALRKV